MKLNFKEIEGGIKSIELVGRMDIAGAEQVDLRFTSLAATEKGYILVDMSEVNFIASIGIRTLLSNAKAVAMKGGKMVLYCPEGNVAKVLDTMDIGSIVPIYRTLEEAKVNLMGVDS